MHFARVLRAAGLPVGPGHVIHALQAVEAVGVDRRTDFYWTLHAVFVNRRDQREIFDQAFHVFWRNPKMLERMMSVILPQMDLPPDEEQQEMARRLAEALKGMAEGDKEKEPDETETELDAVMTWTAQEVLKRKDFEKMSNAELEQAKAALRRLRLPISKVPTRRFRPHAQGRRIDMRKTLRNSLRGGGRTIEIARRKRQTRRPPLVILCDISGSMSRYSRMLLHFLHAVTNDRDRVYTFLFGTRLTNVTRYLQIPRHRRGAGEGRRGGERLVGRHPDRRLPARVQSLVVAPRARPGRDRAADHRRARPRGREGPRPRDRPPAPELPAADLAEPALALRRIRAKIHRHQGDPAARRRFPPRPQSGQPRAAGRGVERRGAPPGEERDQMATDASMIDTDDVLAQAKQWREAGKGVAIATVVTTWGSSPRPVGSQLAVSDDQEMIGSVSGGCIEGAVVTEAQQVIGSGAPKLLDFGVSDEQAWEVGLACGGKVQVFVEKLD